MQFLSISRRRTDAFTPDQFAKHIDAERERVRELYRDGIVRQLWIRGDVAGAVMLIEAPDLASAQAALDSLPLAQRGMLDVELMPIAPYPAFFPRD